MKRIIIVYDVSELYSLVVRDIELALTFQGPPRYDAYLINALVQSWFRVRLEEIGILFSTRHRAMEAFGPELYQKAILNLHSAYTSLLYRIVDVPGYLKSHEASDHRIEDGALILIYHVSELEHARHSSDHRSWLESLPKRTHFLFKSGRHQSHS